MLDFFYKNVNKFLLKNKRKYFLCHYTHATKIKIPKWVFEFLVGVHGALINNK